MHMGPKQGQPKPEIVSQQGTAVRDTGSAGVCAYVFKGRHLLHMRCDACLEFSSWDQWA